jgi:hypothetical protein
MEEKNIMMREQLPMLLWRLASVAERASKISQMHALSCTASSQLDCWSYLNPKVLLEKTHAGRHNMRSLRQFLAGQRMQLLLHITCLPLSAVRASHARLDWALNTSQRAAPRRTAPPDLGHRKTSACA